MLPEGWKLSCLGDACSGELQTGPFGSQLHAHEYIEHGISVLMPKDLIKYRANIKTAAKISVEKSKELKRHRLKFGDILFSRRGDVARLALIDGMSEGSLCGTGCLRARPSTKAFPDFLFFFLQLPTIKSWLEHNAVGQTMPNMNTEILYELPLILPPLPEQKKIAAILSTWDRAIEGTEKLLANSQQQKKALMQQLLTGKKRLPGFTEEWKPSPVSSFIKESRIAGNSGDIARKITIKLYGKGVFPKEEKREGSESTKYYKRKSGQFIYSKLDFLNGAFGIIPSKLDGYESTLDLPAFDFLPAVNSQWFIYYVSREEFYSANLGLANGGRKARRVNPVDLLRIIIPTPPLPEQKAIAAILTTAEEEIATIKSNLSRLRDEKKALMQQLLTGKRRVKVDQEISDTGL
ncbi:restriction endonuclease subunit S [Acetobacter sp. UBA5411]|uniref:restriction endonuclease subunit S n=1 Tax=Acetobacter sp. UBA5411 TaxID=1945905 RepID=UPI0025C16113|nr:restriction endonuclease subunit S [Acetobacter sp. UBA5411]